MADIDSNTDSSEISQPIDFEPIFSMGQIREFEKSYNETWGVSRRCAMLTLSRSKTELINSWKSIDDKEALFELIDRLIDYRQHLESGIEITNEAIQRLCSAGEAICEVTS